MTRQDYISGLLGTPYDKVERHCWWLVCLVQRDLFGRELGAPSAYLERHERERVIAASPLRDHWRPVEKPADGDLVLMARAPGRDIHCGVYLADRAGGVIHTDMPHGVVLDGLAELRHVRRWRATMHGCVA